MAMDGFDPELLVGLKDGTYPVALRAEMNSFKSSNFANFVNFTKMRKTLRNRELGQLRQLDQRSLLTMAMDGFDSGLFVGLEASTHSAAISAEMNSFKISNFVNFVILKTWEKHYEKWNSVNFANLINEFY